MWKEKQRQEDLRAGVKVTVIVDVISKWQNKSLLRKHEGEQNSFVLEEQRLVSVRREAEEEDVDDEERQGLDYSKEE